MHDKTQGTDPVPGGGGADAAGGRCVASEVDPIVCSMELDPNKLAAPGTVNVTITISNSGNTDMKDPVVLYDPAAQIVSDFGTNGAVLLKAGESATWTGTYDVNDRTLETAPWFTLSNTPSIRTAARLWTRASHSRGHLAANGRNRYGRQTHHQPHRGRRGPGGGGTL